MLPIGAARRRAYEPLGGALSCGVDILIVHSSVEVTSSLRSLLEGQGHRVRTAPSVAEALPLLEMAPAQALLAECSQLELNGAPLFRVLGRNAQAPMVFPLLSPLVPSLPGELERLSGMAGQVRRLLASPEGAGVVRVGDLAIDLTGKRVSLHNQQVTLPPIQFRLLAYLAQNAGRVVGARELLKAVWGYEGNEAEARELVKVHVRQIRRKLGLEAQRADYVQSVRGFGYVVTPPNGNALNR